jgi:surface antigen
MNRKKASVGVHSIIKLVHSYPVIISLCLTLSAALVLAPIVHADTAQQIENQINGLNEQNSSNQSSINSLKATASSYQQTIDNLRAQISAVQTAIATNETQQATLQAQITADQTQIAQQKQVLGSDISAIYVNGQMTTLEELASSNNISDFVNAETYRTAVQNKIQSTLDQINTLEAQQQAHETQIAELLSTQQTQQSQLAGSEQQQTSLLSYNQSQQAQYNQQISTSNTNISQLRAELIALNSSSGSTLISGATCGGGYPQSTPSATDPYGPNWGCDEPQDNTTDNWGMDNRECVSYTAFMVHEEYLEGKVAYDMPAWGSKSNNYQGYAYEWITNAEKAGIPVDFTPQPGDIAIRNIDPDVPGDVGHAMYVVSVESPTSITVEEYNEHYNGTFDERSGVNPEDYGSQGAQLYFIHFQEWQ